VPGGLSRRKWGWLSFPVSMGIKRGGVTARARRRRDLRLEEEDDDVV
jgi:hypothetical protein